MNSIKMLWNRVLIQINISIKLADSSTKDIEYYIKNGLDLKYFVKKYEARISWYKDILMSIAKVT